MSTHCHIFSPGVLYGTRGTPIGIIVVTCFLPFVFVIVCSKTFSANVFAREYADPIDRAYTSFILFSPAYDARIPCDEREDEEHHLAVVAVAFIIMVVLEERPPPL